MSQDELFRDRVRERDLDNFLVEELYASARFRAWLLAQLEATFVPPIDAVIRVGKSPQRLQDNRQTDVQLGWFTPSEDLLACVLIESKVTADFQPGQAESYAKELYAWREALGPQSACAVLIAPGDRLSVLAGRELFDHCLAIEDIVSFLRGRLVSEAGDEEFLRRIESRCQLLESLIGKRHGSVWSPITLAEKREFSDYYSRLAAEILPSLSVRPSSDGPSATTKFFTGAKLPSDFPLVRIKHEFGRRGEPKYANLQFDGCAELLPALADISLGDPAQFSVIASGRSLFVRQTTPGIDPTAPFGPQRQLVADGLKAVRDLVAWLETNSAAIALALGAAPLSHSGPATRATPARNSLERAMRSALLSTYKECEKLDYRPRYLLDMMDNLGAIATVRALINRPISDGFVRLLELGRLDLSIEALALEPRWNELFTPAELALCKRRTGSMSTSH